MNKRNILIALGGLILVSVLIYIGKNRSRGELEVNVGKVENRTIISTVSANGKIRPEAEVKISADVSGEITELYTEEGDTVKEGQLLLKINPDLYATYLWNQHKKYDLLEALAGANGLLTDLPGISRKLRIEKDYLELWKHVEPPALTQSTRDYIMHMKDIMHDSDALMAHVYVLHMGDLSGGQMIAKKVPGAGTMYEFDSDTKQLKEAIRNKTNDDMAEEAQYVFTSATNLFKELMELELELYSN